MKKDRIPGGKAKGKTLKDIAIIHTYDNKSEQMFKHLKVELAKGIKAELEHTSNEAFAREIAMDHLYEDPNYYTKLEKMEMKGKSKKIGKNELYKIVKSVLSENSESGSKKISANDLATKYDLKKTGSTGKFSMRDFQPILDRGEREDKYALALIFANMFLGKNFGLSWDDLPDINSLWNCIEESQTIEDLINSVKSACKERISEEGGADLF